MTEDPEATLVRQQPSAVTPPDEGAMPQRIGRYRIERVLGRGGFGLVYLARDDQLHRPVAIKVPHPRLVARSDQAEAYLQEARTVAGLDHPHIVPVFDVGGTDQFPCFVVSKYVDGTDLAARLRHGRLATGEAVALVATVAEALHHAHKHGLVHRDIKPGNILLDKDDRPFVADFGLALREQDLGKGPTFAGTPAYMSPEQARGEGHRVDGRSDIFSLGVVFYELLTGRRPFAADSQAELLELITSHESRPPRQYDDGIPKELERICLKALAKRASERYTTAKDMADDLRHFLSEQPLPQASSVGPTSAAPIAPPPTTVGGVSTSATAATPGSDSRPIKVVPKGLRSFDARDADFFLELLPGPRDRDGLPDSLRFWKSWTEERDTDQTFSVGLIYGPSGCGKSSLVKAGLLPRLSEHVIAVYVEATAEETETRLLNGLRKRCPALPTDLSLREVLLALRRGQGVAAGKKVVIVLDQFEQWLHAKKDEQSAELVQALRQCDGGRVQCVVMVRDDFWMAATRFMRALEVRLLEGQNSAAVDLFPIRHAEKVLAAFGRAFGVLPDAPAEGSKEQLEFLKQAVSGLAQEGKVVSVRLALFAELMKGKFWTPAALREVGGTEGVGVTFLEETFGATTAPPEHRYHQGAARGVLKALLPESGADIKGHMRSHAELLDASGYAARPRDFDDLVRILDGELRLITPTDREGKEEARDSASQAATGHKYYQLTHDYLVPSIRAWLTRKQKETRRGRAELLLADRAAVWTARPESRQLPSLVQWLQIRWHTPRKSWTPPQQRMMRRAGRYHAVRATVLGVLLSVVAVMGLAVRAQVIEQRNATHAAALVQRLTDAETAQVPGVIAEMSEYRRWTDPLLHVEYENAGTNSRQKLHASLALLPVNASQVDYLFGRLLDASPQEVPVIRDALAPHKSALLDRLWAVVQTPKKGQEAQRLRAAAALANYDPDSPRWGVAGGPVVNDLVRENPVFLGQWSEAFRPVKKWLLPRLAEIFRDHLDNRAAERSLATNLLADYAADQSQVLADLLLDADEKQFAGIFPKLKDRGEQVTPLFLREIDKRLPPELPSSDDRREKLAKRQANAAVALLRMNRPAKVWPLLKHSPDPRVRSYLIHRLSPLGADARAVVRRLEEEPDVTIRRALILALGEFNEQDFSEEDRKALLPKLQELYRTSNDPGLHAASEWLLRTWKQGEWLKKVNEEWAKDRESRERRLAEVRRLLAEEGAKAVPQWYVTAQGQTMIAVPGPVEFVMGSPLTESHRVDIESPHKKRISRGFSVAAKSVTVEEYWQFDQGYKLPPAYTRTANLPVTGIDWYMAARYCNWLSKEEGISEDQWCYETVGQVTKSKENCLSLTGYRLPTESELEYVTRADSMTSRYFGETEALMPKYVWYTKNAQDIPWPVGSLKPNDLGLFDVLGNVNNWCQTRYKAYPTEKIGKASEDEGDGVLGAVPESIVMRGGSCLGHPSFLRSAFRNYDLPTFRHVYGVGFRLARTVKAK